MIQKINRLVDNILAGLSEWPDLEAIQRIPYRSYGPSDSALACLKLDVFVQGELPDQATRMTRLPQTQFLETSLAKTKDRFFMDDLATHIEYKRTYDVERILVGLDTPPFQLLQKSTYGLFRLLHGVPVFSRTGWIDKQKASLENLPEAFWTFHRQNLSGRMEHQLSDMGAALFNQDPYHFQTSLARYLETIAEMLFTLNRQFLCPPEQVLRSLEGLEILPAGFSGLLDSLIRSEASVDRERKLAVARRLAEQLLGL